MIFQSASKRLELLESKLAGVVVIDSDPRIRPKTFKDPTAAINYISVVLGSEKMEDSV